VGIIKNLEGTSLLFCSGPAADIGGSCDILLFIYLFMRVMIDDDSTCIYVDDNDAHVLRASGCAIGNGEGMNANGWLAG